ncbi:myo-inositol-1(or 4)-monophosphatase [Azomonas agilis]|uniref:Myo-inositol-1(Or 4)-monophosphatase n=2 Tax=Azomonas agilis TaxID=116849 RepID=A0A562HYW0_9GAMM|nr:myo-inositol-1(or 4)-monophosphatase [Azomonas agilis]
MNTVEARSTLASIRELVMNNLEYIQKLRYNIEYKEDGSPVTEADKFLEKAILDFLREQDPEIQFVGEESFDAVAWQERPGMLAVLDPIDGTENFCSGLKEWGVSVGLWCNGQFLGSMLLMPELGECLITGDSLVKLESRITGFSSSYDPAIAQGLSEAIEYRVTGCAVYNLYNVIRGSFTRFVNPKGAYIWDLLPGIMLALEYKCEVILDDKPYDGKLLDPTRKYRVDIRNR